MGGAIGGLSGALETGLAYTEFLQEELAKKNLPFDDDDFYFFPYSGRISACGSDSVEVLKVPTLFICTFRWQRSAT